MKKTPARIALVALETAINALGVAAGAFLAHAAGRLGGDWDPGHWLSLACTVAIGGFVWVGVSGTVSGLLETPLGALRLAAAGIPAEGGDETAEATR